VQQRAEPLKEATDEELLAACARGEPAAWDALLDRYAGLIYSIALKYGFAEQDAADVFQSVCVTLLEKLNTVRAPRGLAAWIMTTTSRQCLAVARRKRREQGRSSQMAGELPLAGSDRLPEDTLLELERVRQVRAAMSQLPTNCREILEALFAEGGTYEQVAAALGIPANSLGPTRTRCLEKLRRLLLTAGFSP
jgi:RNA polymerase sigma factor (sigma-70 family)